MTVTIHDTPPVPTNAFSRAVVWARKNLFSSWGNSLLTLFCIWVMWVVIPPALNWLVFQANWVGDTRTDCTKEGACWVFIHARFGQFMYGLYPHELRWRINLALVIGLLSIGPMFLKRTAPSSTCPKGVRCPMELSTYFRINAAKTGPVRAHADRRRRGLLRQLPRRLHGADARREPAACGRRRAGRARRRADQVLDGAELVPGRRGGQGGIYNFVTKRGECARRALEDLLDAGRDRLGDHLEVPELHPAGRRLGRRVLLGRAHQQPPAGRHRHQDDPHRQATRAARSSPRASRAGHGQNSYRGLVQDPAEAPTARATTRSATRC